MTEDKRECSRDERAWRIRKNLRILAILIAAYYFASAGYAWYQESQVQEQSVTSTQSSISNAQDFREFFNSIINAQDTSLPTANANDSKDGFVAVLSPAVEIRGVAKDGTKELSSVQVQTRYPNAMPPESVVAFRSFVAACERTTDLQRADEILLKLNFIPEFDKNEDNKVFENLVVNSDTMKYELHFTGGEIDELTLIASPLNEEIKVVE